VQVRGYNTYIGVLLSNDHNNYPFISCKCITYGRVDTLEESIYSFLKQEYAGKKEMIIVNDYPMQNLVFDHPEIKIYNLDKRFDTIGEKENFAMSKCSADIICQWDDDDIAMSNHLNNVSRYFISSADLLHWQKGVLFNDRNIAAITGLGNSGIVFSRKAWEMVGGYPMENAGYDMTFVLKIKANSKNIILASPPDEEVSWFYMWGGRSYHMSGLGADNDSRPNVLIRHGEYIESLRQAGKILTGEIILQPKWNQDYSKILTKYLGK
jgi:glycosyltransferase involved in cell wall biosynthesis